MPISVNKTVVTYLAQLVVLAMLVGTAGPASAQIGVIPNGAGPGGLFRCNTTAASTPSLRAEGYSELLGDILVTCQGGPDVFVGAQIPTATVTVYVGPYPNVLVTSRLLGAGSVSEALLLIDDPGSALSTGATGGNPGYGPNAAQTVCTDLHNGCPAYVGVDGSGAYQVAVTQPAAAPGTGTNAANIYQGVVGDLGPGTVTFYGVPVLPPATTGVSRTFRITNLRVSTVGLASQTSITGGLNVVPASILPAGGSTNIGTIAAPMATTVNASPAGGASPFSACARPSGATLASRVSFSESFATMFKTRVAPLSNTSWASTVPNTGAPSQNIPGGIYNGFFANSESGLILPAVNGNGHTAGLADYGTRLKAVFANIPAGVTLYVSTSNANGYAVPGGTNTASYAVLVAASPGSDAVNDGIALTPLTAGTVPGSDGLTAYPLSPSGGTAAAVWEVVNSNPGGIDTLTFSVYIAYASGTPGITAQPGSATPTVALSFAPEPGGGSFLAANGAQPLASPVARFVGGAMQPSPWVSIANCATVPALSDWGLVVLGILLVGLARLISSPRSATPPS
jgi:hypothetical protein